MLGLLGFLRFHISIDCLGFSAPKVKVPRIFNWVVPTIGVLQNGWFIMENPIKMDDLGVPLFLETPNSKT